VQLTPAEIAAIKAATRLTFGPDAVVRLFGSRVIDDQRAADIDLHIETPEDIDIWFYKDAFLERVFARIDQQRIDVIVTGRGHKPTPIAAIAYRDGVIL